MAWGEEGVTKLQYKQDSVTAWGPGGTPRQVPLTKAGIIRQLRMITSGTPVYTPGTGTIVPSKLGLNALYSRIELLANSQQSIVGVSGYGLYLFNVLKRALEMAGNSPDTELVSVLNNTDQSYLYNGSQVAVPAAPANQNLDFGITIPVAQTVKSLGGDIGMIPMSTENSQMVFSFTPQSSGTASPYNIFGATDTAGPYVVTGNSTATLANPTVDLIREMYEAVQNAADFPDFDWISQVVEEIPQTYGTAGFVWKQNQDAGILARLIVATWDAGATGGANGVQTNKLTNVNALNLSYNGDIVKFKESGKEALQRQRVQFGHSLPQGVFAYDFLGPDLTWADVLNSYELPSITMSMNFDSAITFDNAFLPKVIRQTFLPLRVSN